MSADQLSAEWCKYATAQREILDERFKVLQGMSSANSDEIGKAFDQCVGQIQRVERVLAQKEGAPDKQALIATCRKGRT
ncbi:hypothetical protein D9X30_1070 [Cupriavidus sp. U2]|uniref:hypothetical protein n=1 Tax=Cupriavidus sp. U2 TaxID=2920269 RepID=UPI00129D2AEE|nr:hypothetical protein [Cupriavidus sp. U2]KAI3593895.1 hypothetical protein D9X30_1070 [Cupriavidus sp. U2]